MSSSSATVKHLDTKKFDSTITAFKSGISQYNDIKSEVEKATNTLLGSWQGKGKAQFEGLHNDISAADRYRGYNV